MFVGRHPPSSVGSRLLGPFSVCDCNNRKLALLCYDSSFGNFGFSQFLISLFWAGSLGEPDDDDDDGLMPTRSEMMRDTVCDRTVRARWLAVIITHPSRSGDLAFLLQ